MNKKQILIVTSLVFAVAIVAALVFIPPENIREMPSDRNLSPNRDQAIVQVPRPDLLNTGGSPAGPDYSEGLESNAPAQKALPAKQKIVSDLPGNAPLAVVSEETPVDEEAVYYKSMVFRDEALSVFPVHTVQIHQPKSIEEDIQTGRIGGKNFGPKPNEVWVRIKPDNAKQMREIMAQTADLYREYVNENKENIVVVNWVGGQAWARMEFAPDGSPITQ